MFWTLRSLILASGSPRRKRLLESVGIEFQVRPSDVEEIDSPGNTPEIAAEEWADLKAHSVSLQFPDAWVLGADTIVVLDGRIFGKPSDRTMAEQMLTTLSGRVHEVITGICLAHAGRSTRRKGRVSTRVEFKHLSREEIQAYIGTGEPMDKAGAYGIQGAGAFLVRSVEGSYSNVVGLPLCETIEWLMEEGIIAPASGPKL
ncbi:MAG: Maf family protein [Syntrophobacteraceae bacterium]